MITVLIFRFWEFKLKMAQNRIKDKRPDRTVTAAQFADLNPFIIVTKVEEENHLGMVILIEIMIETNRGITKGIMKIFNKLN